MWRCWVHQFCFAMRQMMRWWISDWVGRLVLRLRGWGWRLSGRSIGTGDIGLTNRRIMMILSPFWRERPQSSGGDERVGRLISLLWVLVCIKPIYLGQWVLAQPKWCSFIASYREIFICWSFADFKTSTLMSLTLHEKTFCRKRRCRFQRLDDLEDPATTDQSNRVNHQHLAPNPDLSQRTFPSQITSSFPPLFAAQFDCHVAHSSIVVRVCHYRISSNIHLLPHAYLHRYIKSKKSISHPTKRSPPPPSPPTPLSTDPNVHHPRTRRPETPRSEPQPSQNPPAQPRALKRWSKPDRQPPTNDCRPRELTSFSFPTTPKTPPSPSPLHLFTFYSHPIPFPSLPNPPPTFSRPPEPKKTPPPPPPTNQHSITETNQNLHQATRRRNRRRRRLHQQPRAPRQG